MHNPTHSFAALFRQLGLPSDPEAIEQFLQSHRPLPAETKLAKAPFWTAAQATFLHEEIINDADWARVIDTLNAALREPQNRAD